MKIINYETLGLRYLLPYLRQNEDIATLIKLFASRFTNLQNIVNTLQTILSIKDARGIWLDYIGKEVGASRSETDYGNYFCVGALHINTSKQFYFLTSQENPDQPVNLQDFDFIGKIMAYIGANTSFAAIEEVLSIIKRISNANTVHIEKTGNCSLKLNLYGSRLLLTQSSLNYNKQIIGSGIYIQEITTNE